MPETRDGRTTDTRARILQEAAQLYLAGSYEAVSMQVIANRLHISKAAIFHHFTNKQELFFEMWLSLLARLQQRLQDAVERSAGGSTQEKLHSLLRCFVREAGFDLPRMTQDVAAFLLPQQRATLRHVWRNGFIIVRQTLEEGIANGELKPHNTQLAAYTLLHLGRLVPDPARPHMLLSESLSQDAYLDGLLNMLLDGLRFPQNQDRPVDP